MTPLKRKSLYIFPLITAVTALSLSGCAADSQNTPEATVEKLLQAISNKNVDEMKGYLTPPYADQEYAPADVLENADSISNIEVEDTDTTPEDSLVTVNFSYTLNDQPIEGAFELVKGGQDGDEWFVDSPIGATVDNTTIPSVLDSELTLEGTTSIESVLLLPGSYDLEFVSPQNWIETYETEVNIPVTGEPMLDVTTQTLVDEVELSDEFKQLFTDRVTTAVETHKHQSGGFDTADYAARNRGIDNRYRVETLPQVGEPELFLEGDRILVRSALTGGQYSLFDSLGEDTYDWVPYDAPFNEATGTYNGSELIIDLTLR